MPREASVKRVPRGLRYIIAKRTHAFQMRQGRSELSWPDQRKAHIRLRPQKEAEVLLTFGDG